jgi:phospholipid-binding lipoprotein MlaA
MYSKRAGTLSTLLFIIIAAGALSGCATTGQGPSAKHDVVSNADPLQPMNRDFFTLTDTLDKYFMTPVAKGYVKVTPKLFRTAVTNFFNNLHYLNVALNSFLQGKIDEGLNDSCRFIFNSTIGLGGIADVSTALGFNQHDEDMGQTLAVWGTEQGPYLFLPLTGPNTVRNLPDYASRYFTNPLTYISGGLWLPISILDIINKRANLLQATNIVNEAAVDKYVFTREAWLQHRRYLIYDGNPPVEDFNQMFDDTGGDSGGNSGGGKTP